MKNASHFKVLKNFWCRLNGVNVVHEVLLVIEQKVVLWNKDAIRGRVLNQLPGVVKSTLKLQIPVQIS